jgi:hypothetical protein
MFLSFFQNNNLNKLNIKRLIMAIRFSFFAYGILAICALALVLAFTSSQAGNSTWASNFYDLAVLIVVLFILYMFAKLLRK